MWGFERVIKASAEKGSYFHPLFLRGRRDLCQEMARQKVKGEKPRQEQHERKSGLLNRLKLPTMDPHLPKQDLDCMSRTTDDSTATGGSSVSSSSSSPRLNSSLLLATLPQHHLLNQPLPPSMLRDPLHVLNALQSSTTSLPPSEATNPAGTLSGMVKTRRVPTSGIATAALVAGSKVQQQSSIIHQRVLVENVLLLKAHQERASSVVLAAALLGNLANPR